MRPKLRPGYNIWSEEDYGDTWWSWAWIARNGTMMAKCGSRLSSKRAIQKSLQGFLHQVRTNVHQPIYFHN